MPIRSPTLHGSAPDSAELALLLIDVINDFEFPEGAQLLRVALPAARRIAALRERAHRAKIPVIYVNDNFGRWRSDFNQVVRRCLEEPVRGSEIARLLAPDEDDYSVLKPKHSGFYSTTLELLLEHLGARTLILTGFAGNLCVLYTANDAYLRDYELKVPADCTASNTAKDNRAALQHMKRFLRADIRPSSRLRLPHPRRARDT